MTITEQIRLKLKTVDEELAEAYKLNESTDFRFATNGIRRARRILREICEIDGESENEHRGPKNVLISEKEK